MVQSNQTGSYTYVLHEHCPQELQSSQKSVHQLEVQLQSSQRSVHQLEVQLQSSQRCVRDLEQETQQLRQSQQSQQQVCNRIPCIK